MREYKFADPDNEGYEIIVPKDVSRQIVDDYRQKTFYIAVALLSGIIGMLLGVLIS